MGAFSRKNEFLAKVSIITVIFFIILGCSGLQSKKWRLKSSVKPKEEKGSIPLYYDFGDVSVPKELKIDNKASYIIEKSGYSEGMLVLKGRVSRDYLIAYFKNNMTADNWKFVALFKSPRANSILLYQKEYKLLKMMHERDMDIETVQYRLNVSRNELTNMIKKLSEMAMIQFISFVTIDITETGIDFINKKRKIIQKQEQLNISSFLLHL